MRLISAITAAFASSALAIGAASATTVQFTDYNTVGQSLTGTFGGTSLTAQAATYTLTGYSSSSATGTGVIDLYGPTDTARLEVSSYGLALRNSALDNSHQIDGFGLRDLALFSFGEDVILRSVDFSFVDNNDDFALFVGDSLSTLSVFTLRDVMTTVGGLDVAGRVFGIGAFDASDNFKITALDFDVAPVPLPAAAPLFAGALMAGGIARRRARRAA